MKSIIFAVTSMFFISLTSYTQNNVQKTDKIKYTRPFTVELGGDLSFSNTTIRLYETGTYNNAYFYTQNNFSIDATAGIFMVQGLKLGIEPGITISGFSGGSGTTTQLKLYFTTEYVLNTNSIAYPYLGVAIGYSARIYTGSSPTQNGISYGGRAGIKMNFFGNSLLNIGYTYFRENYNYKREGQGFHQVYKQGWDIGAFSTGWTVFF
jgi:hypothetical protein